MEKALTIMKLHKLHKSERSLISAKDSESFFVPDVDCGEPFVHGEVKSNSRFQNIGANEGQRKGVQQLHPSQNVLRNISIVVSLKKMQTKNRNSMNPEKVKLDCGPNFPASD
jgi:hypothetical protein